MPLFVINSIFGIYTVLMKHFFTAVLLFVAAISQSQSISNFCSKAKTQFPQTKSIQTIADADENKYDVKYQKLDLQMNDNNAIVAGVSTTIAQVVQAPFNRFVCELLGMQVSTLKINGVAQTVVNDGVTVSATLNTPLNLGDVFTVEITYGGTAQEGVIVATSPTYGVTACATLSESYNADGWWPCKQVLTDKIDSSDVWITVANSLMAGSNGLLQNITPMPNNKRRFEWKSRHPIDYYLISASVADYRDYSIYAHPVGSDSILIQNYIYDTQLNYTNNKFRLDTTALLVEYFSEIYGLYPFADEKYGHCQAPIGGGMEHQTMTTIYRFDFDIVAHELGHQWFGDNVTCASWSHIWVNEGFANYSEYLAYEHFRPADARPYMDGIHSNVIPDYATYGTAFCDDTTDENRIFDYALTYSKGEAIIHSLRFEVNNDSLFFAALRLYQQQNAYGTATAETLKLVFENVTGLNLTDFFNQWYYGVGYPEFDIAWNQVGGQTFLSVTENPTAPNITPFFNTSLELKLPSVQGDTTVRVFISQPNQVFVFNWDNPISTVVVDPNQWILNTVGAILHNTALTDIPAVEDAQLNIYPVPTQNVVAINAAKPITAVRLFDMAGREMTGFDYSNAGTTSTVDLTAYAAGTYVLNIYVANASNPIRKLVVKQ